ncbi:hypothetical protein LDENG_00200530 [Lucifuga dentata]|nr:hypothetical protein LDENG_00200530 [Lucifuga dentata]
MSAVFSVLLLLLSGGAFMDVDHTPITVVVMNNITELKTCQTYSTYTAYRGILIGGLRRLQESSNNFTFTYTEDPNYGPYLESVNGLSGNFNNRTYWELLVKPMGGPLIRPNVGIGCYIPNHYDQIILKFTKY